MLVAEASRLEASQLYLTYAMLAGAMPPYPLAPPPPQSPPS